jgi:hypothetical protein
MEEKPADEREIVVFSAPLAVSLMGLPSAMPFFGVLIQCYFKCYASALASQAAGFTQESARPAPQAIPEPRSGDSGTTPGRLRNPENNRCLLSLAP